MIYTFSGNQLPAIDNKKTLKKMTKCAEVVVGAVFIVVMREKFAEGKQRLLALLFSMFKLLAKRGKFPKPFNRLLKKLQVLSVIVGTICLPYFTREENVFQRKRTSLIRETLRSQNRSRDQKRSTLRSSENCVLIPLTTALLTM